MAKVKLFQSVDMAAEHWLNNSLTLSGAKIEYRDFVRVWGVNFENIKINLYGDFNIVDGELVSGSITSVDANNELGILFQISDLILNPLTVVNDLLSGKNQFAIQSLLSGDDLITGSSGGDWINSSAGDDSIFGGAGYDYIYGGAGNDKLDVGDDGGRLDGEEGNDILIGGQSKDILYGGDGNDILTGGDSSDYLVGGAGDDSIVGGDGDNRIYGGSGKDTISGGDDNDFIQGEDGDDYITAGKGDDYITAGKGNDTIYGGDGNDTFDNYFSYGHDILDGGDGDDNFKIFIDYSELSSSVLATGGAGKDTYSWIEGVARASKYYAVTDFSTGKDGDILNVSSILGGMTDNPFSVGAGYLRLIQTGADTLLECDQDGASGSAQSWKAIITLQNVRANTLTSDNFDLGIPNIQLTNHSPTGGVTISGVASQGNTLTASNNLQDSDGLGLISYQWRANDVYIATGSYFTLTQSEVGKTITVIASYVDGNQTLESKKSAATSLVTGLIITPPTVNSNENISGSAVSDTLDGGLGVDTLMGGYGDDTYIVDITSAGKLEDKSIENLNAGNDTIQLRGVSTNSNSATLVLADNFENLDASSTGSSKLNLSGNSVNNILTGNNANNILNGGLGADSLLGGKGNDTYYVDNIGDVVIENSNQGIDDVMSSISYTLTSNVENLALTGKTAINATGNASANILSGNNGNNILDGGVGNDTLQGADGNDTYIIDSGNDVIIEAANTGYDTVKVAINSVNGYYSFADNVEAGILTNSVDFRLIGNSLANTLTGNSSSNVLDGGAGVDTLIGGLGNDTYIVDLTSNGSLEDTVTEATNGGVDTLQLRGVLTNTTFSTVTLTTNLENLDASWTGSSFLNLTGNSGNNQLIGNNTDNILDGGAGNDTLDGGFGKDRASYFSATSGVTVNLSTGNASGTSIGRDKLINIEKVRGSLFSDYLVGDDGDNELIGEAGNDTLDGGAGIDEAIYNLSKQNIIVDLNNGTARVGANEVDTLINIEVVVTGLGNDRIVGDSKNNWLIGNQGNDSLLGGDGNDCLKGGDGRDTLLGGRGDDWLDGGVGNDTLDGGENGTFGDNVSYRSATSTNTVGVVVNLSTGVATGIAGNDILYNIEHIEDTASNDYLIGNEQENWFLLSAGNDYVDGGYGNDVVMYEDATAGVTINLKTNLASGASIGSDVLLNIEDAHGSVFADTITLSDNGGYIFGRAGNDILYGVLGNDVFMAGSGDDYIDGGSGTNTVSYNSNYVSVAFDLVATGLGVNINLINGTGLDNWGNTDTLVNIQNVEGSAYDDSIAGDSSNNTLSGNEGNDTLYSGLGNDYLTGGLGQDIFVFNTEGDASTNTDVIIDFVSAWDSFQFSKAVFTQLGAIGSLTEAEFNAGNFSSGQDASDRIIYNSTFGALYYDADGSGNAEAVQVAIVGTSLNYSDIQIIA